MKLVIFLNILHLKLMEIFCIIWYSKHLLLFIDSQKNFYQTRKWTLFDGKHKENHSIGKSICIISHYDICFYRKWFVLNSIFCFTISSIIFNSLITFDDVSYSSVTYPTIWRCGVSYRRFACISKFRDIWH
jgi:hypothetical protein